MEILFVRHSKTKVNPQIPIPQWGLSAEGIQLAQKLSAHNVIKALDVIYTSLQTKALETALVLAKPNAISIKTHDGLTEVTSFTQSYEEDVGKYKKNVKEYYGGTLDRINSGETKQEALDRFTRTLQTIVATERDKNSIGIVSHGNILTLFSALFKDIECYEFHTKIEQPDIAVFDWEKQTFSSFFGELISPPPTSKYTPWFINGVKPSGGTP